MTADANEGSFDMVLNLKNPLLTLPCFDRVSIIVLLLPIFLIGSLSATTSTGLTHAAYAQQGFYPSPETNPSTSADQLQKCRQLLISTENCSDSNINARKKIVEAQLKQSTPLSLQGVSTDGNYLVDILWRSNTINNTSIFYVYLQSKNSHLHANSTFDFVLIQKGVRLADSYASNQISPEQFYTFAKQGSYTLRIENINGTSENVQIPIEVSPELPNGGLVIAMMASGLTALFVMRKLTLV